MTFNTEKNKLSKMWNNTEDNKNIIITQKNDNEFIIDNVGELNRQNSHFPILKNFSSEWVTPTILTSIPDGSTEEQIDGNVIEFQLTFNDLDASFIPYIYSEIVYREGTSGVITLAHISFPSSDIPFDEAIAGAGFGDDNLVQNTMFKINGNNVEYITSMRMNFDATGVTFDEKPEIEYKMFCYILNPHYYQAN